ncbi:hypothetical protein POM88_005363 [Heracleum sosnowskyi]|uniref:Uncharacterized protein n=1 Tax=Heracleum sosnowskyi TaxID=360622 RepID=A0AAD8JL35_9APIA|nr:hypothetical protein POM88_005363 [Heracleum sosnowskyi]
MTGKSETSSKVKSSNYDLAANDMPGNLITQTQLKVRSTLLAADDVGGINKIYSSLIREERLRMGTKPNSERTDVMSFAVQSGGGNMSRNEPRLESKEASQWWPDRSKAPGRGSGRGRGSQRSAPFTRQGRGSFNAPRANVASNSIHPSATASTSKPALGDLEKSGLLGLTEDQWQLLKATFQEQTPTTSSMTGPHFEDADWSGLVCFSLPCVENIKNGVEKRLCLNALKKQPVVLYRNILPCTIRPKPNQRKDLELTKPRKDETSSYKSHPGTHDSSG